VSRLPSKAYWQSPSHVKNGFLALLIGGYTQFIRSLIQLIEEGRSVQLLRRFYDEGLVDSYTFLSWAVQQLSISNLAQAGFVLRLTDEYLEDLFKSRILTRPYVDACILKLHEVGKI
jgi:hypothetical protein